MCRPILYFVDVGNTFSFPLFLFSFFTLNLIFISAFFWWRAECLTFLYLMKISRIFKDDFSTNFLTWGFVAPKNFPSCQKMGKNFFDFEVSHARAKSVCLSSWLRIIWDVTPNVNSHICILIWWSKRERKKKNKFHEEGRMKVKKSQKCCEGGKTYADYGYKPHRYVVIIPETWNLLAYKKCRRWGLKGIFEIQFTIRGLI